MRDLNRKYNHKNRAFILTFTEEAMSNAPYAVEVEAGKSYWLCSCGKSKGQPYCDGSHPAGTIPNEHVAEKTGTAYFCGCNKSKNGTMCDGSHKAG
jgi:CDGSH iron-sulfur domain-containing protein 3